MYRNQKFGISPLEDIEEDLQEMTEYYPKNLKKLFVVNGDAFTLPSKRLLAISDLIRKYFPEVECISCYASVKNIKNKSVDDLKNLRAAGYDRLYMGIETAYGPALEQMRKGYTADDEYEQLKKLEDAGIDYNAIIMLGVAGKGNHEKNVSETVKLLNTFRPKMVLSMSTAVQQNTPLAEMRDSGDFSESTERELLSEEMMFLEKLEMDDDCFYFGGHVYNLGRISQHFRYRENMILALQKRIDEIDRTNPGILDTVLERGSL